MKPNYTPRHWVLGPGPCAHHHFHHHHQPIYTMMVTIVFVFLCCVCFILQLYSYHTCLLMASILTILYILICISNEHKATSHLSIQLHHKANVLILGICSCFGSSLQAVSDTQHTCS